MPIYLSIVGARAHTKVLKLTPILPQSYRYPMARKSLKEAKELVLNPSVCLSFFSFEAAIRVAGGSWVVPIRAILQVHAGPKSGDKA